MRPAFAVVLVASMLAGCKKASVATAPLVTDSFSISGAWNGCIAEPHVSCAPVTMTLADSSLTDSTANVSGTGNWGDNVAIHGKLIEAKVTLNATATAVLQGWSFSGVVSGNSISGSMTIPGVDSAYQALFTRTP